MNRFATFSIISWACPARAWLVALSLFGGLLPSAAGAEATPVAHVGLSVGQVQRIGAHGALEPIAKGAAVMEGDRIITGSDGMMVLVFIDDARLSIRTNTNFRIDRYRKGQDGAPPDIRLTLQSGTVRQISGGIAQSSPERYRLNTPIAAIGVRGTDFVAQVAGAGEAGLETYIHSGAIVVLERSASCQTAQSTANCRTLAELSALQPERYLRLLPSGGLERRAMPLPEVERTFGMVMAARRAQGELSRAQSARLDGSNAARQAESLANLPSSSPDAAADPNLALRAQLSSASLGEGRAALLVKSAVLKGSAPPLADPGPGAGQGPALELPPPVNEPTEVPAAPVVLPVLATAPMPTQLTWGRFSYAGNIPLTLSTYESAQSGRHATVGEAGLYALWRTGTDGPIDKGLRGEVQYSLASAEAYYAPNATGLSPSSAVVTAASLSINFDRSTFKSAFSLFHVDTGAVLVQGQGTLNGYGLFASKTDTDRIAGAMSKDGQEAGVLFNKTLSQGSVRGISLWRGSPKP